MTMKTYECKVNGTAAVTKLLSLVGILALAGCDKTREPTKC